MKKKKHSKAARTRRPAKRRTQARKHRPLADMLPRSHAKKVLFGVPRRSASHAKSARLAKSAPGTRKTARRFTEQEIPIHDLKELIASRELARALDARRAKAVKRAARTRSA